MGRVVRHKRAYSGDRIGNPTLSGIEAAPHLSCIGSSASQIRQILHLYCEHGIKHIVALRGDLPSGTMDSGEFSAMRMN